MKHRADTRIGYWQVTAAVGLNAPLVILILVKYAANLQMGILSWIYLLSVGFGYYLFAIFVIASLSYFVLSAFKKVAIIASGLIVTALVYYLLLDSYTFAIAKMHIDLFWLEWIINDHEAFGLSRSTMLSILLALLVLIGVEAGIFTLVKRFRRRRGVTTIVTVLLPILLVVSQVLHALAYETNDARITGLTPRLPFYLPVTSHREAREYSDLLPIGEDEYEADGRGTFRYPLSPIEFDDSASRKRPNLVMLFLESWRRDAFNDSITPNISALARKSTVGLNHFCSGNSTVAGVFGFFYGLHPTYWPLVKAENAAIHNPVLFDVLEKRGYALGIFANSNFKRHKIKDAIFRDIEVVEDFEGPTAVEQDADMTHRLIGFIRERSASDRPFLAFGFYKSNHAPYRYPAADTVFRPAGDQNLMRADRDTDPTEYLNDYRNSVHYVDRLVGNVIHSLDSLGLMSNTIIIVSTDHGEEFNDNHSTYWGHGTNFTRAQVQVPLVLYVPDREPRTIRRVTSHVDVVPTLMREYLGCLNDAGDYSTGQSLFDSTYEERPLVIGSYVNHAFVIDEKVYEVMPLYVKGYELDDINAAVGMPPADALQGLARDLRRFIHDGLASHED